MLDTLDLRKGSLPTVGCYLQFAERWEMAVMGMTPHLSHRGDIFHVVLWSRGVVFAINQKRVMENG